MFRMTLCLPLFLAFATTATMAQGAILFSDFSSTSGLDLNGDASGNVNNGIDPPVLRLVPASMEQVGSTFLTSLVDITSFSTTFTFRISNVGGIQDFFGQTGADGLTFAIQRGSSTALGNGGGGIGYGDIGPSVAVEFDTWYNDALNSPTISDPADSNHLGIDTNGNLMSLVTTAVGGQFDDGNLHFASINYDGTTLVAQIDGTMVSHVIDIPGIVGGNHAFVGFTAATGGAWGDHDIVSWGIDAIQPLFLEPSALYSVRDDDSDGVFDDLGDVVVDVSTREINAVGEVDATSVNMISRLVAKFALPDAPAGEELLNATLRFNLFDILGTPAGPLSLLHSTTDNDLDPLASDYEDSSYDDTLLDLIEPTDPDGRVYELDVTDLVLADYAADGLDPLSAFRLQVDGAVFFEDQLKNNYRLEMPAWQGGKNPPQLALFFAAGTQVVVPEPSSVVLAVLALLALLAHGRRNRRAP